MMKTLFLFAFCLLSFSCSSNVEQNPAEKKDKSGKQTVDITMKDGINLSTDIFLPKRKGKYPAVLVRTPYGKWADAWMGKAFRIFKIAVVLQDVRGKNGSGGEFYPFINEREDGLQTLNWIRKQPWSDGTIAGWGGSYLGYTQWAVSDSLDFMTLLLTGANIYDFTYPDSLFSLQSALNWGFENASQTLNKISPDKLKKSPLILPISVADDSTLKDIPFLNDWIKHENYDEYWQKMNFRGKTKAPLISMAGWYDIFLKSQLEDFQALLVNGNPDNRMIIGPWAHGALGEPNEYGGLKKTGKPTKIFMYVKNFLKGRTNRLTSPLKNEKYNLFIMERNEYVGSAVWPPAETKTTPYYIGPSGYLSTASIPENGNLKYTYLPSDPYPSHGGTALGSGVGPARQNENIDRKDQLVFEMKVQEKPMILLGPVSATLWLSSDVPCTNFMVGLQDVFPDGKIINIQEGGAKVRFDNKNPKKTEISVWATGYQLNPGHRLRAFISSSWFPRYNRSLNSSEPSMTAKDMVNATQEIYYGGNTPSSINLPVYTISK
jgi:putative CocE/NonD family hydrolase